jgi:diguanylate cyclase (GGDEF)-like protein
VSPLQRSAAIDELVVRFRDKVRVFITENRDLFEAFGSDAEKVATHSGLIAAHVLSILAAEPVDASSSVSASIGRAHADHVVKPSRYLGAYDLLLGAYSEAKRDGVKGLPSLSQIKMRMSIDINATLDSCDSFLRGRLTRDHAALFKAVADLEVRSKTDFLTGLYNRGAVQDLLNHSNNPGAFVLFDLDGFKLVNDSLGHGAGDRALQEVAGAMKASVRQSDTVGRVGGDEFCLWGPSDDPTIWRSTSVLVRRVVESLPLLRWNIGISAGISFRPQDGMSFEELYERADQALYVAKSHGAMTIFLANGNEEMHIDPR